MRRFAANRSHFKMMPHVPIVGWDVAFTPTGVYLLEVRCDLSAALSFPWLPFTS